MKDNSNLIATLHSSESNEWYTPAPYVEAARQALGRIAFDPASSEAAQKTVKADRYLSLAQGNDGLIDPWADKWFCNPPYGWRTWKGKKKSNQALWVSRAINQYLEFGYTGIMLINSNTEAKYMEEPWRSFWKCFPDHRITFDLPPGAPPKSQPTKGNVFILFGDNWEAFGNAFGRMGSIVPPIPKWRNGVQYAQATWAHVK
jgi:hypothetical protein